MPKSKEEWRLKLASLLQDGDISVKHPRIEKKIWDCVQDAIESEAVKRENFAFNKGRTTHSQNREAEIRKEERERIQNLVSEALAGETLRSMTIFKLNTILTPHHQELEANK